MNRHGLYICVIRAFSYIDIEGNIDIEGDKNVNIFPDIYKCLAM
mgnify:CR=1 FL=1